MFGAFTVYVIPNIRKTGWSSSCDVIVSADSRMPWQQADGVTEYNKTPRQPAAMPSWLWHHKKYFVSFYFWANYYTSVSYNGQIWLNQSSENAILVWISRSGIHVPELWTSPLRVISSYSVSDVMNLNTDTLFWILCMQIAYQTYNRTK